MNPNNSSQNQTLLDGIYRRGALVATSVRYWRGCKRLNPEDLGLDPAHVSDRLIQLGHKRLIPRDALSAFALIESRVQATVESSSFPSLGVIDRFVPHPRLGELTDKLEKLRDEFREATLDFVAGYTPRDDRSAFDFEGKQLPFLIKDGSLSERPHNRCQPDQRRSIRAGHFRIRRATSPTGQPGDAGQGVRNALPWTNFGCGWTSGDHLQKNDEIEITDTGKICTANAPLGFFQVTKKGASQLPKSFIIKKVPRLGFEPRTN